MTRQMTCQRALDREIAQQTGEDLRTIRGRGFSVIDLQEQDFDPEANLREPLMFDWDEVLPHHSARFIPTRHCLPA